MNEKILMFIAILSLSACGGEKKNDNLVKSAFINNCINQESSTRSAEQAKSYCDCAADAVFNNKDISDETKNLMPTMSDKDSKINKQHDIAKVRGLLMSCYTTKFYKK